MRGCVGAARGAKTSRRMTAAEAAVRLAVRVCVSTFCFLKEIKAGEV